MEAVSEIALQTREINQNIKRKGASGGEPDECLQLAPSRLSADIEAVLFARRRLAISPHTRQNNLVKTVFKKVSRHT